MFTVKFTPEMDRGLYATRDIETGEVVELCELLVLSPEDTLRVNITDLQYYTFVYNREQDCLVLGHGEIFNHSDNPNVCYKIVDAVINGHKRPVMQFETRRRVKAGEQLFIDYAADTSVDATKYVDKNLL